MAFAFRPVADVLANQVLQEFRFAGAGPSADIEMLVALVARETKAPVSSWHLAEN